MSENIKYELRPDKLYFYLKKLLIVSFISLFFLFIAGITGEISLLIIPFVIMVLSWWVVSTEYRKTSYTFLADRLIYKTGTVFSDSERELPIKNITHVKLSLPFIFYKFFNIGNIKVESAGSDATEGNFIGMADPKNLYISIEKVMKGDSFSLKKKNLEVEMLPNKLAVMFETFKYIFIAGAAIILNLMDAVNGDPKTGEEGISMMLAFGIGSFALLGTLLFAIFQYFDLKKRIYKVYNDTITYSEGFLTKHYTIIPFENITDSKSTQTVVDRIFGLYDVSVSCQGAKKEIHFKNIIDGEKISQVIRTLLQEFKNESKQKKIEVLKSSQKNIREKEERNFDTSYTSEFEINKFRFLVFPLFLFLVSLFFITLSPIIPLVFFCVVIIAFIPTIATKYVVDSGSIKYTYKFIKTKKIEFFADRITSVVLRESWIDKIFGTCHVHFGSIGSAEKIKFNYIKKSNDLYTKLLQKSGIQEEFYEENNGMMYMISPKFSIIEWIKSSIFASIALIIFLLIFSSIGYISFNEIESVSFTSVLISIISFIGIIILAAYFYLKVFYKRASIQFFKSYLCVKKGIIIQTISYAGYDNIKDIKTVKYPLTQTGSISFDIAGEDVIHQDIQNQKAARYLLGGLAGLSTTTIKKYSHELALKFIPNIPLLNNLLDQFIEKDVTQEEVERYTENFPDTIPQSELSEKPELGNTLIFPIILFFPLIAFLFIFGNFIAAIAVIIFFFIVCGLIVWSIKSISFEIQPSRVVKRSGIFYKNQVSILFSKLDNINKSQGLINKIFRNGNIKIYTVGSSKVEIKVNDLDKYEEFYTRLKEKI